MLLYTSETWPMTKELVGKVERTDMRMARWICGVSLRDKISNKEVRGRLGIKSVEEMVRQSRLRWFGHVERQDDTSWTKRCMNMEVAGTRLRGRPKTSWCSL